MNKIKTKTNPRPKEEYLDMFKVLDSLYNDLSFYIADYKEKNKDWHSEDFGIIWNFTGYDFNVEPGVSNLHRLFYSEPTNDFGRWVHRVIDTFPKDNQIVSYLKFLRAYVSYCLLIDKKDILSDMRQENYLIESGMSDFVREYGDALEGLDAHSSHQGSIESMVIIYIKKVKEFGIGLVSIVDEYENKLKKYVTEYNSKFPGTLSDYFNRERESETNLVDLISSLSHYVDVWRGNKKRYKPLMDYSWANKTPIKVEQDLERLESELLKTMSFDDEYTDAEGLAEPSIHFLKINDKVSWYRIDTNVCRFEAFIGSQSSKKKDDEEDVFGQLMGSHCGRDPDADILFSLRGKNEKDQFVHYATVGARKIGKIDGVTVYAITQSRGRKNSPIHPKLWLAMLELYKSPVILTESDPKAMYRGDTNFSMAWLGGFANSHSKSLSPVEDIFPEYFERNSIEDFHKHYESFVKAKPLFFSDEIDSLENIKKRFDI